MRTLNRMLICIAAALATLLPSTSYARDGVYFNFGYSSGYPANQYRWNGYPAVIHAAPLYPPPVRHYHHHYTPRHYYADRCPPRGYLDGYRPDHHGRRDHHRNQWRGGDDRYYPGQHGRRGGSRVFVEMND